MAEFIHKKASHYEFDTDPNGFPTFTEKNLEFLKAILRYDSNYSTSSDKDAPEYKESYAGILERGNFFCFDASRSKDEKDELGNDVDDLYRVIASIDKINSTHLSSEGNGDDGDAPSADIDGTDEAKPKKKRNKGRAKVAQRIREYGGQKLKEALMHGDDEIISIIASAMVGGKHNFSFATKFCSYVSIHALGLDNYCIYDEVLQSVLPYYAYMYLDNFSENYSNIYKTVSGANERNESLVWTYKDNDDYKGYRSLISEIIKGIERKVNVKITYEDFDHLVWYYFKGSKGKVQSALRHLPERKLPRKKRK